MSDQPTDPTGQEPRPGEPAEPQPTQPEQPTSAFGDAPTPSPLPSMSNVEGADPLAPQPPGRSGMRYAAVAVIVLLLAGGAYLVSTSGKGSATLNAGTPVAAVESMIDAIGEGRIIDLMRSEFPWAEGAGSFDSAALETAGLEDGRISGLKLEGRDLTFDVREIGDQIAVVSITGGSFHAGFDVSELPDALRSSIPGAAAGIAYEDDFPVQLVAQGLCQGLTSNCDPTAIQIVTVDDGAGWRASILHTVMYLATDAVLQPRSAGGASSPEAMEEAIEGAVESTDVNRIFDLLDPLEFSWLRDFDIDADEDTVVSIDLETTVREESSGTAMLHIDSFQGASKERDAFTGEVEQERASFDGDCFYEDSEVSGCLSQLQAIDLGPFESLRPALDLLATEGINLGLVEREGAWYLSLKQTLEPFAPALEAAAREFEQLARRCQEAAGSSSPGGATLPECAFLSGGLFGGYGASETLELQPSDLEY